MWLSRPILRIRNAMPAKVLSTPALPGLSPVGGKPVIARFDGGHLSSDGGLLVLREVEQRLDVAGRLAACLTDPRDPKRVVHGLDEIIRFRLLMLAAGYEDGNDADRLRTDPMFKLAMDRLGDETALCSQPTISRLENLPDTRAAAHGSSHGRSLLRILPPGAAPDRPGRGRPVRRGARGGADALVQRAP